MPKKNVVFVCESNSCRSQMAEGFAGFLHPDIINAFSAGIKSNPIDKLAIKAMQELGIDISGQETHRVQDFLDKDVDFVITVCTQAAKYCPTFPPSIRMMNETFDNPPEITRDFDSEEEKLREYRRVRDEIREFVEDLPALLGD